MQDYYGFKYVDSLEKYLQDETAELMEELERIFVIRRFPIYY